MPAISVKQKVLFLVVLIALIVFPITAFADGADDFDYIVSGGEIVIIDYLGDGGDVVIPDTIDGKPVTGIDYWAFSYYDLTSVTIPASIKSIGALAFEGCYDLTQAIFLGDAPSSVGDDIFLDCGDDFMIYYKTGSSGWTNPWNGYKTQAFDPAATHTVTYNGNGATSGDVPVDSNTYAYGGTVTVLGNSGGLQRGTLTFVGWNTKADGSGKTYTEGSTFSMSVTDTVLYAEWDSGLEIGEPQEWEQDGVTWYYTPQTPTACSVDGCDQLSGTLTIPGTINGLDVTSISPMAFGSSDISSVVIPEGVQDIGFYSFYDCRELENVTLPESLEVLGPYAFFDCWNLKGIIIPVDVADIGPGCFAGCSMLESIGVDGDNDYYASVGGVLFDKEQTILVAYPGGKTGAYTVPSGVTEIYYMAFESVNYLTSITIPGSVQYIDDSAFSKCSSLSGVTIPASVRYIGAGAFESCPKLTAINVNTSSQYFKGVSGVLFSKDGKSLLQYPAGKSGTSYSISSTVHNIGEMAFSGCKKLTAITIPSSIDVISEGAFAYCDGLTSVTIQNGVLSIEDNAFYACQNLKTVSLPASVTEIGSAVFDECLKMNTITVNASNTAYSSQDGVLFDKSKSELIYYPAGNTRTSYTVPDGVEAILDGSFYESAYLQVVRIPASVDYVGFAAFAYCSSLAEAHFRGNAPDDFYDYVFEEVAGNFKIYYPQGMKGWSTPKWNGYDTVVELGVPTLSSAASAGYDRIALTWAEVANADGYEVYYATSSTGTYSKAATVNSGSTLGYTVTGLTAGNTYYFEVRAYSGSDATLQYGDYSTSVAAKPVPAASGAIHATPTNYNSVTVSWDAVPGASGYQVYRATSEGGKFSLIKTTSSLSCTDTGLGTGTAYYYEVKAYCSVGRNKVYGDFSASASATPVLSSVVSASAEAYYPTSVKVSWSAVPGRTKYEVMRSTEEHGTYTRIGSTTSTYYKDTTCTPFVTYYYQIMVYRTVNRQPVYSASASPTASAKPILGNVTGVTAVMAAPSSIKISWGSVTGASGYEVLRAETIDGHYTVIKSTSSRSYTDVNLIPNTTYYYQVRAYRKVSTGTVSSTESTPVSATTYFGSVTSPRTVRISATKVYLSWGAVSGRTGYEIYRSTSPDKDFVLVKSTTSTSFTDSGLTTGVTYYYKIVAYRTVNNVRYRSTEAAVSVTP